MKKLPYSKFNKLQIIKLLFGILTISTLIFSISINSQVQASPEEDLEKIQKQLEEIRNKKEELNKK